MPSVTIEHGTDFLTKEDVEVRSVQKTGATSLFVGNYTSGRRIAVLVNGPQGLGKRFHLSDGQTRYLSCVIVRLYDGAEISCMDTEPVP